MHQTNYQPVIVSGLAKGKHICGGCACKYMKKKAHRKFRRECKMLLKQNEEEFEFPDGRLLTDWDIS